MLSAKRPEEFVPVVNGLELHWVIGTGIAIEGKQ
jgi:hypothetical protein